MNIKVESKIAFYYGIIIEIMGRSEEICVYYMIDRLNILYYTSRNREAILECVMGTADLTYQDLRTSFRQNCEVKSTYKCTFQRPLKIPLAVLFLSSLIRRIERGEQEERRNCSLGTIGNAEIARMNY